MQRYVCTLTSCNAMNAIFNTLRFLFSQYSTYRNGLFYYQYKRADALCRHRVEYAFYELLLANLFLCLIVRKEVRFE